MPKMQPKGLSDFETMAQRLVEGSVGRFFGRRLPLREVARQLARALDDSHEDGVTANVYEVALNPADYQALQEKAPALASRLQVYLRELAVQGGLSLAGEPQVHLVQSAQVARGSAYVEAQQRRVDENGSTQDYSVVVGGSEKRLRLLDAFVIVNGKRHVPLDKALVTIGRRVDNDIIVDSPAVSRTHAHLRWRYGRFVLYDAGSRGGIAVNGKECRVCVLQPGDLIVLSGQVSLIYGEGLASREQLPAQVGAVEQETLALRREEEKGER